MIPAAIVCTHLGGASHLACESHNDRPDSTTLYHSLALVTAVHKHIPRGKVDEFQEVS